MKAVQPVVALNGVFLPQTRSVGSHSTSRREKNGKNERTGKGTFEYEGVIDKFKSLLFAFHQQSAS